MELKNLKFSYYRDNIFLLNRKQKIEGMNYGVMVLSKSYFNQFVENVDLTVAAYPIPRNLRERIENNILPRFYEILEIIEKKNALPEKIGIEISQLNKEDILYGLESSSINKLLIDRGIIPEKLKKIINSIQFSRY